MNHASFVTQAELDSMVTCNVAEMMKHLTRIQVTLPNGSVSIVEAPTLAQAGHDALAAICKEAGVPVPHAYLKSYDMNKDGYAYGETNSLQSIRVKHV